MADSRQTPRSPSLGPRLPALERLAPTPDAARLAAQIEARSSAGDVVLELHGRGGWVARSAIDDLRRAFAIEGSALTRLVAEIVLRPPDLRHFDAAVSAISVDARGMEGGLRHAVESRYASRCASCDGPVTVDEYIWEADATDPSRKSYECSRCREGRGERRPVAVDADDLYLARSVDRDAARAALMSRFPAPSHDHPLRAEVVDLYPPRTQVALAAIIERIESEIRAPSVQAALRLTVMHMAPVVSRLNGYPGRVSQLRITDGQVRLPSSRQWRERNAWTEFGEACRVVRGFVQSLASDGAMSTPARVGPDLRALVDGSANVALRFGTPVGPETFGPPPRPGSEPGARPRVKPGIRLVLTQPPIHWSPENVAFAYLATSLSLGSDAAATLPLATIFGSTVRSGWARDAATLQRSLTAVRPVLLPDAEVVIALDQAGPESLVASVIGGVGAGLRVDDVVLGESGAGLGGTVQFALPRSVSSGDRDVAIQSSSDPAGPFHIAAVEAAIADIAVAVIQLRGEPTRFDRILGEVLLGLDHLGHLRRLVGVRAAGVADAEVATEQHASGLWGDIETATLEDGASSTSAAPDASDQMSNGPAEPDAARQLTWSDAGPASDPVRLTLDMIRKEMKRDEHPRLVEVDEDLWWLSDPRDLAAVKPPLAERVEWGIFSLLSTSGGLTEGSFRERVGHLYRGPETADRELVDACLASYRRAGASQDGLIHTDESLQQRYQEHGEIVGTLVEFAHRIGMRAWITKREQRRLYNGAPLSELLSDPEQRVYLPLVAPGPQELLEEIDCVWYVRGRGAFLFDVEWMAALEEPIRQRGPRIDTTESLVRFLVVPDERVPLVRLRLARSPLLRRQMETDNWHILKWSHVRRLPASKRADLSVLSPLIGLDPPIEKDADQMALFG